MKKIFTLLSVAAFGTYSYGQRTVDLSIQSIVAPTELQSVGNTTPTIINAAIFNDGPDNLMAGDTIFFLAQIVDGNNTAIAQTPNAHQLVVIPGAILHRDVSPTDTFHVVMGYNFNYKADVTMQADFVLGVFVVNRPGLNFEPQGTIQNNIKRESDLTFFNEYRFPLNTASFNEDGLSIYPNPVSEEATIYSAVKPSDNTRTLNVYDVQGKLVYTETQAAGFMEAFAVNTSQFDNGVYIIRVSAGDVVQTGKLVVQH